MANEIDDLIRRRAYAIWETEGRPEGLRDSHWHRAAREIEAERQSGSVPASDVDNVEKRIPPEPAGVHELSKLSASHSES